MATNIVDEHIYNREKWTPIFKPYKRDDNQEQFIIPWNPSEDPNDKFRQDFYHHFATPYAMDNREEPTYESTHSDSTDITVLANEIVSRPLDLVHYGAAYLHLTVRQNEAWRQKIYNQWYRIERRKAARESDAALRWCEKIGPRQAFKDSTYTSDGRSHEIEYKLEDGQ